MIKEPPNLLRLMDGELVMADGSDVREYLRAWADRVGVTPDTPLSMIARDDLMKLAERATSRVCLCKMTADERFALAA